MRGVGLADAWRVRVEERPALVLERHAEAQHGVRIGLGRVDGNGRARRDAGRADGDRHREHGEHAARTLERLVQNMNPPGKNVR